MFSYKKTNKGDDSDSDDDSKNLFGSPPSNKVDSKNYAKLDDDTSNDVELSSISTGSSTDTAYIRTIDDELREEEERISALLKANEEHLSKWWKRNLIFNLVAFLIWMVFYFGIVWGFDIDSLANEDVVNYYYRTSYFDVFILYSLLFVSSVLALATISSDQDRNFTLSSIAFWMSFTSLILTISKAIVTKYSIAKLAILSIISLSYVSGHLFLQYTISPKESENEWDPNEADEKEKAILRAKQHEEAIQKAEEIAHTLSGSALAEHLEKERLRVKAYEFTEKQALREKIMQAQAGFSRDQLMMLFKPYFWPDTLFARGIVGFTWVFLIMSKVASISAPLFIGYAMNDLVTGGIMPWGHITAYAMLQFGAVGLKQLQSATYLKVKQTAFLELAKYTFRHIHSLSIRFHTKQKTGNILRQIDRGIASCDNVVNYLFLYLLPSFIECLVVFVIFFVKFNQPILSSVVFVHLVIYITITVQITIWRKKYRKATVKYDNEFHDRATESFVNFEAVKLFNTEDFETDRYAESVKKYQQYSVGTQISLSLLNSLQSLTIQSCILFSLFSTAYQIVYHGMSIGDFAAVNAYVLTLYAPLSFLGTIYDMIVQAFVDMKSLCDLMSQESDVSDKPNALPLRIKNRNEGAEIEFKNVSFSYDPVTVVTSEDGTEVPILGEGQQMTIDNVSFKIPRGTFTAFVGTSGAGKSTLSKLLLRLYNATTGAIYVDGQNINDVAQSSLRGKQGIAVVPQDCTMFNDTMLYNIKYGNPNATMEQVEAATKAAQIWDFIQSLPEGFDTMLGARGLRVSGGERARIAISRGLLTDAPVLLLDESSSSLDTVSEKKFQIALRQLEQGKTTIAIAHRLTTIIHADQIIVMEKGKIKEKGTHEELLALQGKYFQLWTQQLQHPDEFM